MDKQTLSNYGWIVIAVLVLAVMIALATPFGEYIKAGVESTTAGLFDTSENAMNVVGMSAKEDANIKNWEYELDKTTNTVKLQKYIGSDSNVYVPSSFKVDGQTYSTLIKCEKQVSPFTSRDDITSVFFEDGVKVERMSYMFRACHELRYINQYPDYDGVEWSGVFYNCYNLMSAPQIPNNIENIRINSFFSNCKNLIGNYTLPDSINPNYKYNFSNLPNINKSTNVLWFGDSITSGTTTSGISFVSHLCDDLNNVAISNYAVGGHTLSYGYDNTEENIKASVINDINILPYSEDIDYVFVSAGSNDFAHKSSRKPLGTYRFADIGTVNDTTPTTVSGAINVIAKEVAGKFPNATLVFTTPLPRDKYDVEGATAADTSVYTVHLKDFVNGMKATFDAHGYNYIDSYTEAGIDISTDLSDATHPTLEGQEKLAEYYLNKLVSDYGFTTK